MRELLGEHADAPEESGEDLPDDCTAELKDGFEIVSGCVLPRDPRRSGPIHLERDKGEDETGVECQVSKWSFIAYRVGFDAQVKMGIAYAFALKRGLEESGVEGPFRVILGADRDGEHPSVTVRYHRVRDGQPWLGEDLEAYKNHGVMAIDFACSN